MGKDSTFVKTCILLTAILAVPAAITAGWANIRILSPFAWHSDLVPIAEHTEDQIRREIRTIQALKQLKFRGVTAESEKNRQRFLRREELRLYHTLNKVRVIQGKDPEPVPMAE